MITKKTEKINIKSQNFNNNTINEMVQIFVDEDKQISSAVEKHKNDLEKADKKKKMEEVRRINRILFAIMYKKQNQMKKEEKKRDRPSSFFGRKISLLAFVCTLLYLLNDISNTIFLFLDREIEIDHNLAH